MTQDDYEHNGERKDTTSRILNYFFVKFSDEHEFLVYF